MGLDTRLSKALSGVVLLALFLVSSNVYAACIDGQTAMQTPGGSCGNCHGLVSSDGTTIINPTVTSGSGYGAGKSQAEWEATLNKMVSYAGNRMLNGGSVADVADYLTNSVGGLCPGMTPTAAPTAIPTPATSPTPVATPVTGDCAAGLTALNIATSQCGTCHALTASDGTLVKGNIAPTIGENGYGNGKSEADWVTTINRMVGYGGTRMLGGGSVADIANYLAISQGGVCVTPATPTPAATATATPAVTATATPAVTATATPAVTATATPAATASPVATATPTGTVTPAPTSSPTTTPTATPTDSGGGVGPAAVDSGGDGGGGAMNAYLIGLLGLGMLLTLNGWNRKI